MNRALTITMNLYITAIIGLLLSLPVQSEQSICPDKSDFRCLVSNSFAVYKENPSNWWAMYGRAQKSAFSCKSSKDAAILLSLWSGETDGEMRSGITDDTGLLIANKTECFLNGFIALKETEKNAMLGTYCPFVHASQLNQELGPYAAQEKYTRAVGLLISRHNVCQAMVNKASNPTP